MSCNDESSVAVQGKPPRQGRINFWNYSKDSVVRRIHNKVIDFITVICHMKCTNMYYSIDMANADNLLNTPNRRFSVCFPINELKRIILSSM